MLCSIATGITKSDLQSINELEKNMGKTLLAFKCHDLKPAALTEEELSKVQAVEKELGIALVAVV